MKKLLLTLLLTLSCFGEQNQFINDIEIKNQTGNEIKNFSLKGEGIKQNLDSIKQNKTLKQVINQNCSLIIQFMHKNQELTYFGGLLSNAQKDENIEITVNKDLSIEIKSDLMFKMVIKPAKKKTP